MSEPFNPLDPKTWRVQASGTEDGQKAIRADQASLMIAQPLLWILRVLFDFKLIAEGDKPHSIVITTPSQQITVTVKVERRQEDSCA